MRQMAESCPRPHPQLHAARKCGQVTNGPFTVVLSQHVPNSGQQMVGSKWLG